MELLIRLGVFRCIYVSFLMVGHTHNDADQKFVPITKQLRRENVHTIHDLLRIYKAAYKEEEPKCIEHDIVEAVHDLTQWLVVDHGEPWEGMASKDQAKYRLPRTHISIRDIAGIPPKYRFEYRLAKRPQTAFGAATGGLFF